MSCHFSQSLHFQRTQEWGWLVKAGVPIHPLIQAHNIHTSSVVRTVRLTKKKMEKHQNAADVNSCKDVCAANFTDFIPM